MRSSLSLTLPRERPLAGWLLRYNADIVMDSNGNVLSLKKNTHKHRPLATSACGEVGSGGRTFIKELAIRRVEHTRLGIYSNESEHLAERTEVACLRRRLSFALQQALSFRKRHISADKEWCMPAPDSSVHKVRYLYTRIVPRG